MGNKSNVNQIPQHMRLMHLLAVYCLNLLLSMRAMTGKKNLNNGKRTLKTRKKNNFVNGHREMRCPL